MKYGCAACDAGRYATVEDTGECWHDHKQVLLAAPDGETVNVDEHVAAQIERLWSAGVRTYSSCEDDGNDRAFVVIRAKHQDAALRALPGSVVDERYGRAYGDMGLAAIEWSAAKGLPT